jgi:hypothetical protein
VNELSRSIIGFRTFFALLDGAMATFTSLLWQLTSQPKIPLLRLNNLTVRDENMSEDEGENEHRSGFVEIRFLVDVPETIGLDGKRTGPFKKGTVYVEQSDSASFYVKRGQAEYMRPEPSKPTLKELFTGSTLDTYLEAARTRPLVAQEMENQAVRRWSLRTKAVDISRQIREEREKHGL